MYIVRNLHNYFPCKKLLKWVLVSLHCEISEPHFIAEHCSKSNENDYQIGIYFRLYHFFFGYSLKYDENEYPIGTSFGLDYTGAARPCFPNNSTQTRAGNNTRKSSNRPAIPSAYGKCRCSCLSRLLYGPRYAAQCRYSNIWLNWDTRMMIFA